MISRDVTSRVVVRRVTARSLGSHPCGYRLHASARRNRSQRVAPAVVVGCEWPGWRQRPGRKPGTSMSALPSKTEVAVRVRRLADHRFEPRPSASSAGGRSAAQLRMPAGRDSAPRPDTGSSRPRNLDPVVGTERQRDGRQRENRRVVDAEVIAQMFDDAHSLFKTRDPPKFLADAVLLLPRRPRVP